MGRNEVSEYQIPSGHRLCSAFFQINASPQGFPDTRPGPWRCQRIGSAFRNLAVYFIQSWKAEHYYWLCLKNMVCCFQKTNTLDNRGRQIALIGSMQPKCPQKEKLVYIDPDFALLFMWLTSLEYKKPVLCLFL
jgi:hypothetical protein